MQKKIAAIHTVDGILLAYSTMNIYAEYMIYNLNIFSAGQEETR